MRVHHAKQYDNQSIGYWNIFIYAFISFGGNHLERLGLLVPGSRESCRSVIFSSRWARFTSAVANSERTRQSPDRQNRGRGVGASQCRRGRAQSGVTAQAMVRSCRHAVCRRRTSNGGVHELLRPIRRQLLRRRVHALQHLVPRGKQKQPEGGPHLRRSAGHRQPSLAASGCRLAAPRTTRATPRMRAAPVGPWAVVQGDRGPSRTSQPDLDGGIRQDRPHRTALRQVADFDLEWLA